MWAPLLVVVRGIFVRSGFMATANRRGTQLTRARRHQAQDTFRGAKSQKNIKRIKGGTNQGLCPGHQYSCSSLWADTMGRGWGSKPVYTVCKKHRHRRNVTSHHFTSFLFTSFHFFDYFRFFDNFYFFEYLHFFEYFHLFNNFQFFDFTSSTISTSFYDFFTTTLLFF